MFVSDAGLALIRRWEGFIPYLYDDDPIRGGNATVSVGHLVHVGRPHEQRGVCAACDAWPRRTERGMWLSERQGIDLLRFDVQRYADAVNRYTSVALNQAQFDALVDFTYNVGQGGYQQSSVRRAVNSHSGTVCAELKKYVTGVNGVYYEALARRRAAECAMYGGAVPPPAPPPPEEVDLNRLNGIAGFPTGRVLGPERYLMNVDRDFAGAVPPQARGVRIEVFTEVTNTGVMTIRDANGNYAGKVFAKVGYGVLDVFIGPINEAPLGGARGLRLEVGDFDIGSNRWLGLPVKVNVFGILGWF